MKTITQKFIVCGIALCISFTSFAGGIEHTGKAINNTCTFSMGVKTVRNVTCNGGVNGTATGNALGGKPPYKYAWSTVPVQTNDTATNLSAAVYTLTITDSAGCTATDTITIHQPALVLTTASASPDTICFDGAPSNLMASSTGGNGQYTYLWSPSINLNTSIGASVAAWPLVTTTYTLISYDTNKCQASPVAVTVNVDEPLRLTTPLGDTVYGGTTVTLSAQASGGNGHYTYTWQPGNENGQNANVSPTTPGWYTVIVSDGCTNPDAKDSVYLIPDTNFDGIYIDSLIKGGCNNSIWVATNAAVNLSQFSFVWSTVATTDTISGICSGSYTVTITDNTLGMPHHRPSMILHISIVDPNSINTIQNNSAFSIYPVPANYKLNIVLTGNGFKPQQAAVYDVTGRELYTENVSMKENTITLNVSKLESGIYMLILIDGNMKRQAKFIVSR